MFDVERSALYFSDLSGQHSHGRPLHSALRALINSATSELSLHSCELGRSVEFIFQDELTAALLRGVRVQIIGNHEREVRGLIASYADVGQGIEGWRWVPREERSLYHIKAIAADGDSLYIGSANLTPNAMTNSAEWGAVFSSLEMAQTLHRHTLDLKDAGFLTQVTAYV